jgi:hypothetical protein
LWADQVGAQVAECKCASVSTDSPHLPKKGLRARMPSQAHERKILSRPKQCGDIDSAPDGSRRQRLHNRLSGALWAHFADSARLHGAPLTPSRILNQSAALKPAAAITGAVRCSAAPVNWVLSQSATAVVCDRKSLGSEESRNLRSSAGRRAASASGSSVKRRLLCLTVTTGHPSQTVAVCEIAARLWLVTRRRYRAARAVRATERAAHAAPVPQRCTAR